MRRHLVLLTMLTFIVAASASAQVVVTAPSGARTTRDDVVARLMSFDLNHDGRVTRAELPERMHDLLTRGDVSKDGTLDAIEAAWLAERPSNMTAVRGFQAGQYGFGDTSLQDSRLHIEGAIEDLRLTDKEKEKALEIAQRFDTARQERTRSELLETMGQILTSGSLEDFKAALDRPAMANVRFSVDGIVVGPNGDAAALAQRVQTFVRIATGGTLARVIDKYGLQPAEQQRARAAIEQYSEARSGRLSEGDRAALLQQLNTLLDDEQLDDLRAALERRPVVKQNAGVIGGVVGGLVRPPVAVPAQGEVRLQNLVLKD